MGRTGRKRQGCIVVILAEGREERVRVLKRLRNKYVMHQMCHFSSSAFISWHARKPPTFPQIYNQSQSNKRSLLKSIVGNKSGFHMYPNSPRMLPEGVNPTLHKMHITCGQFDNRESIRRSVKGRRSHAEGRSSLIHPQNLSTWWGGSRFLISWITDELNLLFWISHFYFHAGRLSGERDVWRLSEQCRVFPVVIQHEAGGRWSSSDLEEVTLPVPAAPSSTSGFFLSIF